MSQIPGALTDNVVPADCYAMGMWPTREPTRLSRKGAAGEP
jgi:hypothetical protein